MRKKLVWQMDREYGEAPMKGAQISRPPFHHISLGQILVLVPVCTLVLALGKHVFAISILCGGLVAILPQAYFAVRAFRWQGARAVQASARLSYGAVIGKFMLSAAGFAAVFAMVRPVDGLAVFVGYITMLTVQITGSWLLLSRSQ
ncbi:MAG: ATP synthase protein I [Alcanivorax sp.]|jgi:ATP synthase protein I